MKQKIKALYLSYVNDFLTIEKFAEHYNISAEKANKIINLGRKLNNVNR
jgi:hypothetical protein